jgi:MFS family permease
MRLGGYLIDHRPLAIPAFRRLWAASAVTAVGGSFSLVAVPAQLFAMTGSSAAVGQAAGVSMVALVAAALWSGSLADVMDRRILLLAGHAGLAAAYLGLWLTTVLRFEARPAVFALVALQGVGLGVTMTTLGASVPRLVPADLLVAANSLASVTRYTGAMVGPLLAGLLFPIAGPGPLYLLDSLALAGPLWAVARLPALPPTPAPAIRAGGALRRLGDGFRYLAGSRVLVGIVAVDLAAMVFALPFALFAELAVHTYGDRPGGGPRLGLLYAAYPAGVLVAGLLSRSLSRVTRPGAAMAGAALVWGGCVVLLGLTADLGVALVALAVGGMANFVLSTLRNAIAQAHTDDALRGRIQGSLTVVLVGGPQLANLLHGLGGAAIGPRWTVGLGGALTLLTVALLLRFLPALRQYRPPESVLSATRQSRRAPDS